MCVCVCVCVCVCTYIAIVVRTNIVMHSNTVGSF